MSLKGKKLEREESFMEQLRELVVVSGQTNAPAGGEIVYAPVEHCVPLKFGTLWNKWNVHSVREQTAKECVMKMLRVSMHVEKYKFRFFSTVPDMFPVFVPT